MVINMIPGGPTSARITRNSHKSYTRKVMYIGGEASKRAQIEVAIDYDDSDLEGLSSPMMTRRS